MRDGAGRKRKGKRFIDAPSPISRITKEIDESRVWAYVEGAYSSR